ncbi:MAG: hypothetical protein H6953_13985 [Chromatiaceae bacterium]|nr:hypothetical protein [Chromatiaceae bacterium]MCP5312101.1 hypothetical protein [Chromatiaceae bacterium]
MANDMNPQARTEVDWTGTLLQVALLPPLVPVLVFIVATTVSGFQSQGGTAYMPLLSEVWSLALGGFWWALPNLALTPVTLLLRHHAPSVVVGLSYAALVAVVATALVVHLGWLGDPYEWNGRVGALVTAPLFVMPLLAFCLAMRASPVRGGSLVWLVGSDAPARHLSTAAYLLWLGIGVGFAWWSLADIHSDRAALLLAPPGRSGRRPRRCPRIAQSLAHLGRRTADLRIDTEPRLADGCRRDQLPDRGPVVDHRGLGGRSGAAVPVVWAGWARAHTRPGGSTLTVSPYVECRF